MRLSYPDNVKIIQVPCTGRVDIIHILRAIEDGADGVYIAGCLEGECHFLNGNIKTRKKVEYVKKVLKEIGFEPERVEMFNLSSAMGPIRADCKRNDGKNQAAWCKSCQAKSCINEVKHDYCRS